MRKNRAQKIAELSALVGDGPDLGDFIDAFPEATVDELGNMVQEAREVMRFLHGAREVMALTGSPSATTEDSPLVTHEPEWHEATDWPADHVRVEFAPDDVAECLKLWVHGHTHYLHAATARELVKMLDTWLAQFNELAKQHGAPPV